MDRKTEKVLKNQHCCQCWSPRYRVSVLSTKCGGCLPKGLIVASSYKIKKNKNNINFNVSVPILLFTRQEKKSTEFLFYPTSSPHKKPGKYVNFDSPAGRS